MKKLSDESCKMHAKLDNRSFYTYFLKNASEFEFISAISKSMGIYAMLQEGDNYTQ